MFRRKIRSVLLVDFDNIAAQLGHANFVASIPRWLAWLEDGRFDPAGGKRSFIIKRMYWNTSAEHHRRAVEAQEFEALLCPSKVKGKKSLADMVIAVDALRAAYESQRMRECIVLAVDTDYEPLLDALKDCSHNAVIAATPGIAMEVYSECADIVIPIDDLRQAMAYERARSTLEVLRDKIRTWRRLTFLKKRRLARAARHLADIGRPQPGQAIAKKTVMKVLEERMRLKLRGSDAYLSCGNYDTMLEQIQAAQPDKLMLHTYDERRRAIALRPPRPLSKSRTQPTQATGKRTKARQRARARRWFKRANRRSENGG